MKKIALTAATFVATAGAALAQSKPGGTPAVPEIDALAGVAAIAVVGAAVALIRERSKR